MQRTQGTVKVVSGSSFARGVLMDNFLDEKETKALYEKWDNTWGEPYEFPGNSKGITAEQVNAVSIEELVRVYGKKKAAHYAEVAKTYAWV